jgi:hypothetical protein
VHFEHARAGNERKRLAVFVEFDVVAILAILAIGRWTVAASASTAATTATLSPATAATTTTAAVVSGLASTVSTAAATTSTTTAAPSIFLGHVSQNPYLDPLQKNKLSETLMNRGL